MLDLGGLLKVIVNIVFVGNATKTYFLSSLGKTLNKNESKGMLWKSEAIKKKKKKKGCTKYIFSYVKYKVKDPNIERNRFTGSNIKRTLDNLFLLVDFFEE